MLRAWLRISQLRDSAPNLVSSFSICTMYSMYRFASRRSETFSQPNGNIICIETILSPSPKYSQKVPEHPRPFLLVLLGSPRVRHMRVRAQVHERGLDVGSQRSSRHSTDEPNSATSSALISTRSKSSLLSGMKPSSSSGHEKS